MTTNHIDQLAEWWENAEKGTPREGDTYIARFPGRAGYDTGVVDSNGLPPGMLPNTRILARAPKRKPAWYDAVAVIAETKDDDIRRAFVPQYDTETGEERVDAWADWQGAYDASELIGPVPLIEAKVTDEMVERARHRADALGSAFIYSAGEWHMREVLTAALGLEAE